MRVDDATAALLGRRLAWLLRRDVPVEEALARLGPTVAGLRAEVAAGASLPQAFERQGKAFPPQFVAGLQAGGEDPAQALEQTARLLDESRHLRWQLEAALFYPRCLTLGLMLLSFSLYFWCLATRSVTEGSWEGSFSNPLYPAVTLTLLAGLLVLLSNLPALDGLRWRLPILGDWLRRREAASLLLWLEPALASGRPLPEALRWAVQASESPAFRDSIRQAADELEKGAGLGRALEGRLPAVTLWLVARAEQRGFPPGHLSRAAALLARQLHLAARRGLEVLTPALLLLAGMTLFLLFRAGLWPLLNMWRYL